MKGASPTMDPRAIQDKVAAFTQQLLHEAKGDPIRALGLLVLVLDGAELPSPDHAWRLMLEVRHVLMPDSTSEPQIPTQHLIGDVSWEGIQHCLRCGKVLARDCHQREETFVPGYIFEIGPRLTSEPCDDYRACT